MKKLCVLCDEEKDINKVKTIINNNLNKNQDGLEFLETELFGKQLK